MQEEIENRTVNLVVTTSRLSVRAMMDGIRKFVSQTGIQKNQERSVKAELRAREKAEGPHGKQTVKQLMQHGNGLKRIPVQGESLKEFERVLKRYGVDFAIMKEAGAEKPRFLVFFKAKDEEVLNSVLAECTRRQMENPVKRRPSVLKLLEEMKEKVAAIPRKDRMREKDLSL